MENRHETRHACPKREPGSRIFSRFHGRCVMVRSDVVHVETETLWDFSEVRGAGPAKRAPWLDSMSKVELRACPP